MAAARLAALRVKYLGGGGVLMMICCLRWPGARFCECVCEK
jgi:hypothetical protein